MLPATPRCDDLRVWGDPSMGLNGRRHRSSSGRRIGGRPCTHVEVRRPDRRVLLRTPIVSRWFNSNCMDSRMLLENSCWDKGPSHARARITWPTPSQRRLRARNSTYEDLFPPHVRRGFASTSCAPTSLSLANHISPFHGLTVGSPSGSPTFLACIICSFCLKYRR